MVYKQLIFQRGNFNESTGQWLGEKPIHQQAVQTWQQDQYGYGDAGGWEQPEQNVGMNQQQGGQIPVKREDPNQRGDLNQRGGPSQRGFNQRGPIQRSDPYQRVDPNQRGDPNQHIDPNQRVDAHSQEPNPEQRGRPFNQQPPPNEQRRSSSNPPQIHEESVPNQWEQNNQEWQDNRQAVGARPDHDQRGPGQMPPRENMMRGPHGQGGPPDRSSPHSGSLDRNSPHTSLPESGSPHRAHLGPNVGPPRPPVEQGRDFQRGKSEEQNFEGAAASRCLREPGATSTPSGVLWSRAGKQERAGGQQNRKSGKREQEKHE